MKQCNVLLVSPAFPLNMFWNIKATSRVQGARHPAIPLGLLTVAALLPPEWTCRLVDCNVSRLTDRDLDWADLVMSGGMNVQQAHCLEVIEHAHRRGKPVAVGGPDVTSQPDDYAAADFIVTGEAEGVIQQFIDAWNGGLKRGRFAAELFSVDVSQTPVPRFDLVRRSDYLFFSLQFSRGCPFTCEFCDIIELYGRRPRVKTIAQFLNELDGLYRTGYRGHLDFVDDNFIGNKKAVKALLPALIEWQKSRGYPFWFSTEASLNLADDDALLASMRAANFAIVFVGIESPDTTTLVSMQKKQNTRRSIAESVHRIYGAGMLAIGGFIIGFDTERESVGDEMIRCIEEAALPISIVGLLVALPNTQLARRLKQEGRLFPRAWLMATAREQGGDQCTLGLNFETLRPQRDVLVDYKQVIDTIYSPAAYFERVARVVQHLGRWPSQGSQQVPQWVFLGLTKSDWLGLFRILTLAARTDAATFIHVIKAFRRCLRETPGALEAVGLYAAFYLHLGPFSRLVSASIARRIAQIDSNEWRSPLPAKEEPARQPIETAA
jgi:radical SAM superfamily enzyme YgiQ (UPF0313 family)